MLLAVRVAMLVGVLAAYLRVLAGAGPAEGPATAGLSGLPSGPPGPATRATSLEDSLAQNTIHGLTNGCFERAAVAERLPTADIVDVATGLSLKQCEHRCSSTAPPCGAFSFGVHSNGNTTCELGRSSSARINQHPDFDLYVRRPECDGEPPEAPSLQRPPRPPQQQQHSHHLRPPLGSVSGPPYAAHPHRGPAYGPEPWGDLRAEHMGHVPFDNVDHPPAASAALGPPQPPLQDPEQSPSQGHHQGPPARPPEGLPPPPPTGHPLGASGPDAAFNPDLWALPPGHNPLTKPALEFVCFRRVLAGGRLHEQLIRRSLPADHVDRCRHACKVEDHFTCEGFNYRPGLGSCELTAVPLSLLEPGRDSRADRDYDYYARDRNAQPPHCPGDDLYGPGPVWGPGWGGQGAQPAQPAQGTAWPGSAWGSSNALGAGYAPGYANGYAPAAASHQGEIGFYGGSASGTSGAGTNRNDYNYMSNEVDYQQHGQVKPGKYMYDGYGLLGGQQQWPYGSYGGGYGNGAGGAYLPPSYIPPLPPQPQPAGPTPVPALPPPIGHPPVGDGCFVRSHGGFRMAERLVRMTVATASLPQCERECATGARVRCSAFAFRYNSWPYNCDLSEVPLAEVNEYSELVPDRNADIFGREPRCAPAPAGWDHDAECFERVRSGQRLAPNAVRDLLHAPSLGACQTACLAASAYVCRAFTFRFGPASADGPPENCLLSDWPADDVLPWRDTLADPAAEMYQRSSFGRGCELWRRAWPAGGPDAARPTARDQYCYVGYGGPARLLPAAVLRPLRVPTELDCKAECSRMWDAGEVACSAFSFRSEDNVPGPNCLLSEFAMRDLRPGLELVRDPAHWLFAWNEDDPRCARGYGRRPRPPLLPGRGMDDDLWGREEEAGVWRRFSVSGQACRSLCAPHAVGFWSCALESGGWDYCCRPGHSCGYSEGFDYPWCYVGSAALDQWRPCSERYRPYPGGDQDSRYWPVSYLHPAPPPNGPNGTESSGQGYGGGKGGKGGHRDKGGYSDASQGGKGGQGGGKGGYGDGGSNPTTTERPKDLVWPAVPRNRPGFAPVDDGEEHKPWMPSVGNLPARTSKFILDHPEYYNYNYVRLTGGPSSNGTTRHHPPASGAGKDCPPATSTTASPPTSSSTARADTADGKLGDVVLIGGAGDAKAAKAQKKEDLDQVDDDDDFLSAAAAIVRTNTPASPTSRKKDHSSAASTLAPRRAQGPQGGGDEDGEETLELEVVDAVDSAGTMASRNGTLTIGGKTGSLQARHRGQDAEEAEEDAAESDRLERVALVERVDPKLGLTLGEAPRKAKVTVFRRQRRTQG